MGANNNMEKLGVLQLLGSEALQQMIFGILAEIGIKPSQTVLDEEQLTISSITVSGTPTPDYGLAEDAVAILIVGQKVVDKGFESLGDGVISYIFQYGRYQLDIWVKNKLHLTCLIFKMATGEGMDGNAVLLIVGDTEAND